MKKYFLPVILILLSSCNVKYWGLVPDTISINGYVDLNSGLARIYLEKKYSNTPVTSASVLINGVLLRSDTPGVYLKKLSVSSDTFHLHIETLDEMLNFTEFAPSPRNLIYHYTTTGDSLKVIWERPENVDYFEFITIINEDTVLDTILADTEIVFVPPTDSLHAEILSISGPVWSDSTLVPNIDTGIWEGKFKIISHTYLNLSQ